MKYLPKSVWITVLAGVILFLLGDLYTSFGFLVCAAGGATVFCAWLLELRYLSHAESEKIRKAAIAAKRITFTLFLIFLLSFFVVEGLILTHRKGTEQPDARTLIVLGAGLHGEVPSATLASRLQVTLDYLKEHPDASAIVTGGQGPHETVTEASAMARWLTERGIEPHRILLEEKASNTVQNLAYSKVILEREGLPEPVAVVSNGFHLFRAEKLAKQAGLGVVQTLGAPVPQAWLIPSVYLREYCSVLLMLARSLF